jgi:hypothetical protein
MIGDISNSEDVINVEDITNRVEELESERGDLEELREAVADAERDYNAAVDAGQSEEERESLADDLAGARKDLREAEAWADENPDDAAELETLAGLLNDMQGYGGDHQWRGDWYPGALIRESYFVEYCEQMLKDIGDLPDELPGYIAIDWDKTADNLRVDYSTVDYDGVEYLYR